MEIMYHCTKVEFIQAILELGLQPIRPISRLIGGDYLTPKYRPSAVFVSEYPFKWMHWAQALPNGKYVPGALLTVNIKGLKKIPDPNDNYKGDWAILESIQPNRILKCIISNNETPTDFKEISLPKE